ncbi:MAG TPA: DUF1648 domain-containing protein [Candidatus Angelobacter sp.]
MKKRYFLICGLIILATLVAGLLIYPHLPERVPSHWDIHGKINGYESRLAAVLIVPAMMVLLVLAFAALPALSPRHFEIDTFQSTYLYLMLVIIVTLAYFHGLMLWAAFSPTVPMTRAILGGICVLWILMGNVLGRVRRNFYVGIRTPWTLASEQVWYATHRLGGRAFVWTGLLGLVLTFVLPNPLMMFPCLIAGALIPVVYSFVYYKRLEREGANL